jgi:hypothetical protein
VNTMSATMASSETSAQCFVRVARPLTCLAATFVGVGHLRTATWVRPSPFVLGARF